MPRHASSQKNRHAPATATPAPRLKITPAHPRLWITPTRLPEFRQAAKTYRRPYFQLLREKLEPLIGSAAAIRAVHGENPDAIALALGQAWRITGDEKYGRAALWMLEGLWVYPTETRHDYDVWGATAETAAILYDWFHDYWQKIGATRRVAEAVAFCTRQALSFFLDMYIVDDWHNYGLGLQAGVLAGALALGHDFPDLQRCDGGELLSTIHAIHFTGFAYGRARLQDVYATEPTRMCLDDHLRSFGGIGFAAHQEACGGYHYVDAYEFVKMADYWTTALQPAARPVTSSTGLVWPEMNRTGEALLQFLRPDLCNLPWGDSRPYPAPQSGIATMLYHLNAREPAGKNPVFAEYLRSFGAPKHLSRAAHALLCATPETIRAHPVQNPHVTVARRTFDQATEKHWPLSVWRNPIAVLRSGWDQDATQVSFRIGRHGGGHNHFDHNSFTLYRGGPLAIDSGWVDYVHRSRTEYSIRTLAHNSLLVRNPHEKSWIGRHTVPTQNDGGQRLTTYSYSPPNIDTGNPHAILTEARRKKFHDEFAMGELIASEFHTGFDYIAGDATRAYTYPWSGIGTNPSRRVEEFVRQLVFLKPDLVVIFDRVEATRAEYEKIWLLHTQGDPVAYAADTQTPGRARGHSRKPTGAMQFAPGIHAVPAHATIETECHRGRMTLWPLLPATQTLRVIGGKGYETFVEHPAPQDLQGPPEPGITRKDGGINFTQPPDTNSEPGRWRIELRPQTTSPRAKATKTAQAAATAKPAKRDYFLTVLHAGLKKHPPARNQFQFTINETPSAIELTIVPTGTNTRPTTLAFTKKGPVTLTLSESPSAPPKSFHAPAPKRVPRARK